jgi:hypothetical protein
MVVNSSDRALKYFEKAYENCFKLLQFYSKKAQKFILGSSSKFPGNSTRKSDDNTLLDEVKNPENSNFIAQFYDFQKCNEAIKLSNLLCMQIVFLKFTKNQIFNYEIVREIIAHMNRIRQFTIWETTFLRKFDIKNLIHLFYLAFSFGRRTFKIDIRTNILILFDFFKNLVSLSNKFLDFHFERNNRIISNLKNSVGWSHFSRFSLECDSLKIQLNEIPFKICQDILRKNQELLTDNTNLEETLNRVVPEKSFEKNPQSSNRGLSELFYYTKPKTQKFFGIDINDEVKLASKSDALASNTANLERFILKENDLNYFIWLYDYLNDFLINQFQPFPNLENSKKVAKYYLVIFFENIIRNGSPVFHDIFSNSERFASGLELKGCNWNSFKKKISNMFELNPNSSLESNDENESDPLSIDKKSEKKSFQINSLAKSLLQSHSNSVNSLTLSNTPKFLLLRELYDCFKFKYMGNNLKKQWEMLWRFMSYVPDYFRIQQNKKLNCRYSELMHSNMECLLSNANDVKELKLKGKLSQDVLRETLLQESIKKKVLDNIANGIKGDLTGGWVPDHELVFDVEVFTCLKRRINNIKTASNNIPMNIKIFREEVMIHSCFKSPIYGKFDKIEVDLQLMIRNYFAFKLFDRMIINFNLPDYDFSISKAEMQMDVVEVIGGQGNALTNRFSSIKSQNSKISCSKYFD